MSSLSDQQPASSARELVHTRELPVRRSAVFGAILDPARIAQWWGPAGFTNTIHLFEPHPGGRWHLTMHAPNGASFSNEWTFAEIAAPERIVLVHERPMHRFELIVTLAACGDVTALTWRMRFGSAEEADQFRPLVTAANEQNLDRLEAHLASEA
jgi:uncharacterized protein YndB with AHSA1/START domain